jgi:glycosyltransferase involved in cell wall biosynthesis
MVVETAPRRLRIALVYSRVPLPMTRADQMTMAHLIEYLTARGHLIDLFTLDTGEPISDAQREWLAAKCNRLEIARQGFLMSLLGLLGAMLHDRPLQVGWFTNYKQIACARKAVAAGGYDVIYTYYIRSAEVARGIALAGVARKPGQPATFLALQLSQALNTRRIAEHATRLRDKIIYGFERASMRRYESRVWRDFSRTVLIGRQDVDEIRAACREQNLPEIDNYLLCAHGVDTERFRPRPDLTEPLTLVVSGVMRTNTNIQAVTWFVRNCWPAVKAAVPGVKFLIVGRSPPPEVTAFAVADPAITVTGEVPDPANYIARATVCINSMQAGAGMQNKLIEYLASGKAVVATPVANEGVGAAPGTHLIVAESPESFARAVIDLLRDPDRRARLGSAAREYIERNWTWEKFFAELEADMLAESRGLADPKSVYAAFAT